MLWGLEWQIFSIGRSFGLASRNRGIAYDVPDINPEGIRDALIECVRRAELQHAYVNMIMTRGISEKGNRDPRLFKNRFYAFASPTFGSPVWISRRKGFIS
ncbi:MAG: hypothetical protein CM1200mP41_33890 [Gammaproteobacteria bacterium]|nr:MAG: hypothetical protein CM1200mP41_33890 [Gammaproteobacteria bacterium]